MRRTGIRIFIVAGRTGHSLIVSKVLPFAELEEVSDIFIFSEEEGFGIQKSKYITQPLWFFRIKPIFIGRLLRFVYEPIQLIYYAYKFRPDFINGVYCIPKGLNSLIAAKLSAAKCLVSVIGSKLEIETEFPLRRLWEKINLWILIKCDAISVKGRVDIEFLMSKNISKSKMFCLNGAIDLDKFSFYHGARPNDLLFIGSFYELKGPDRFIKIIKELIADFPDIKAIMVGDGHMWKDMKQYAIDSGLEHNIIFTGFQKHVIPYLNLSKILIMPSRSESLPTSMLEAMSTGCVPVISDVGNIREVAVDKVNSRIIVKYDDIDSYVSCIKELLTSPFLLDEYRIKGRQAVEKDYSVIAQSKIAKDILNYLTYN